MFKASGHFKRVGVAGDVVFDYLSGDTRSTEAEGSSLALSGSIVVLGLKARDPRLRRCLQS
jgi:hypothetical protein